MAGLKRRQNRDIPSNSEEKEGRGHYNSRSINQLGLLAIGVAAITISLIFLLFYRYEKRTGEKQLIKDGVTLCSLTADLVRHALLGEDKFQNLNLLDYVVREKGLEYCLVIDNKGVPLIRLGRQIPAPLQKGDHKPGEKSGESYQSATIDSSAVMESILTQKRLKNKDGEVVYEFSKPIYLEGDKTGLLKIGLALSNYIHFSQEGMYLAGCIALSIFGLGFLFYYLLKRLFSPLNQINYNLRQMIKEDMEFPKIEFSGKAQVPHLFQGEIGQLAQGMNQLLLRQQKTNQKWEEFNAELEISNKILIYEKSRMRAILDNIKIGLVVIDSTGRAILANKLARHFLMKSPQPPLERGGGRGDGETGRRGERWRGKSRRGTKLPGQTLERVSV